MYYMLTKDEVISLIKGETKVKEVLTNDRVVLITWSGEDIKEELKRRGVSVNPKELEDITREVRHNLENCDCATCVTLALDPAIKEVKLNSEEI
jgi:tRNA A37 threonylcarbamoyladenosine biosynthesis protein TsaE